MKINKWIQVMAKNFWANKIHRPTLAWIKFKWNKAVATNSYKLMEVEFKEDNFITNEDLKLKDFNHFKKDDEIMIKTEDINSLKLPKSNIPYLDWNIFIWNIEKETFSLCSYNIDKDFRLNSKQLDWNFPDFTSFFWNDNLVTTWIWVDETIELLQTYKSFWIKSLKLQVWKPLQPIQFEVNWCEYELDKQWIKWIKSILMPIKL